MKLLFLAPSRLSRGDAVVAADLARTLPRSRFNVGFSVGFVAAPEALTHLHDLGMPALPLAAGDPAGNVAELDRIVRGFKPDWLIVADAFALHGSRDWSGLTLDALRERYGRPVATVDRLGWPATDYAVDFYGGPRVQFPRLLDGYDLVIRTGPPHPPEPGPAGVTVARLHQGGLRDGGLRRALADSGDSDAPLVFLVNSPWEYDNPRSLPALQLVDALPRLLHSHLAALGRPLRVVHVGPRRWRFAPAGQIEYRHFGKLPYPMFHEWLAAADLFLTTNVLSATLAQAVLAGVPSLVLHNDRHLGGAAGAALPDWVAAAAPLLHTAYPFHVAPLGWYRLLEPLLRGNPYQGCYAAAGLFDRPGVVRALAELLDDQAARSGLRQRQHDYRDRLAGLPPVSDALREAVTR